MNVYVQTNNELLVIGYQVSSSDLDVADLVDVDSESTAEAVQGMRYIGTGHDPATLSDFEALPISELEHQLVDKIRFLDLLGPAAIKFKVAIKTATDPVTAATLEVAEQYLNAASTMDLESPRMQGFLSQLQQVGILTADEVARISANQTAEEAAAATS